MSAGGLSASVCDCWVELLLYCFGQLLIADREADRRRGCGSLRWHELFQAL